jgi:5'-nucleotidase
VRILVDMDGVIADWSGGVDARVRLRAEDAALLDWTRWDGVTPDAPEADRTRVRSRIKRIQGSLGFYRHLHPIPGAVAAIRALDATAHDVWLCTTPDSLSRTCASEKIAWAEDHLGPGWGTRVILTHDKALVRGDFLIDDKPEITGSARPEWQHILFDQPYNQHVEGVRILNWSDPGEVVGYLEGLHAELAA